MRYSLLPLVLIAVVALTAAAESAERGSRNQPDTGMGLYAPEQHELYDGRFVIRGTRIYQAGALNDPSPWDHMDSQATWLIELNQRRGSP